MYDETVEITVSAVSSHLLQHLVKLQVLERNSNTLTFRFVLEPNEVKFLRVVCEKKEVR